MNQDDTIDLLLSGDTMLGRGVNRVIRHKGPFYPLASIASITNTADLFFTNLECVITSSDQKYSGPHKVFYFHAEPEAVETLTHAGVDFVSLANNHTLDADYTGLTEMLEILDNKQIKYAGAGKNLEEASQPVLFNRSNIKVGVLAYCDHQNDFAAGSNREGIRYVDISDTGMVSDMLMEVRKLSEQVDHLIVSFHWQANKARFVDDEYRYLAGELVDAGASVIWGHSPHHFQGIEWIGHSAVIYSSGGLVDDYAVDSNFRNDYQLLFNLTLSDQRVEQIQCFPIELKYSQTLPASSQARQWIETRFEQMCGEVGSRISKDNEWLTVLPAD